MHSALGKSHYRIINIIGARVKPKQLELIDN
jgi:hypothetical protein